MAKKTAKPDSDDLNGANLDWVSRTIRFPKDLYERIEADAKRERRSTQLQVIWMLEEHIRFNEETVSQHKLGRVPLQPRRESPPDLASGQQEN